MPVDLSPEATAALATALTGLAAVAVQVVRTGQVSLTDVPWRALRRLGYVVRRTLFTVPRPPGETTIVTDSLDTVRNHLGAKSYNPGWPLSYRYHGEDLNARRYYYRHGAEYPHRQIHVRGFEQDDGRVALRAHDEPAPEHHPRAHLREVDLHDATAWLAIEYRASVLHPQSYTPSHADVPVEEPEADPEAEA